MGGRILEITFTLIAMFLVITNAENFSKAANAVGNVYINAVSTLQGRQPTGMAAQV
jgi:hypothetical protein